MDISPSNQAAETSNNGGKVSHFFRRDVQNKIAQHPCYSKNAHQYARMHLPVAPACNIQCNYCNRKYDCSNESRPGVVSNLLQPGAALKQFCTIKKRVSNLTVVGIAGPGDALANPKATFATLELIRREDPTAQLCISTNGLMLPDYVERLKEVGVKHLTITINCLDPDIGAQIYPWVFFNHKRLFGKQAAQILIARQLEGLTAAARAGMLVKVNTVLIPGINDSHIDELAEKIKQLGALMHNIMPLISAPEHGTYFGLHGQPGPNEEQLEQARNASGVYMPQMTHCKQCRADAVGTLGGGCASDSTQPEKEDAFKVAIARTDKASDIIDTHFGHAQQFDIYQYQPQVQSFHMIETRVASKYCSGAQECADDEQYKQLIIDTISDCQQVLCSRMGIAPWRKLERKGVTPNVDFAYLSVELALNALAEKIAPQTQRQPDKEAENEICHYG